MPVRSLSIPICLFLGNTILSAAADTHTDSRLHTHAAPKPLAPNAVTAPWPRFLGPADNATTPETPLVTELPEDGPTPVWEVEKGEGYASPAIDGGHLVLFHRMEGLEIVECRHPETGKLFWKFDYTVDYRDRYGYSNGPRAGPILQDNRVYTCGVTNRLHCLDLSTGKVLWERDLAREFNAPQNFFGAGASPLLLGEKLVVSVGAEKATVLACDPATGRTLWTVEDAWGASYASPVATTLHGKARLLVYAGGESKPAHGGLLLIDPETGTVEDRFPWRADKYESVNASTPVAIDDRHVYISECYQKGGVMLHVDGEMKFEAAWKAPDFGMHWMTPIHADGYLYGFRGRNEPDAFLACYHAGTGEEQWRETLTWKQEIDGRSFGWGFFRGSLLRTGDNLWICLGELGTLALLEMSPQGVTVVDRVDLFRARSTWTTPALHRGLLYVSQNEPGIGDNTPRRLLCYDLRK